MAAIIRLLCPFDPALQEEIAQLRRAGEAVVVWMEGDWAPNEAIFGTARSAAEIEALWEDERIAIVLGAGGEKLPEGLDPADFTRGLVIADESEMAAAERAGARLLELGLEAVELLSRRDCEDLSQSWGSGRRTGIFLRSKR